MLRQGSLLKTLILVGTFLGSGAFITGLHYLKGVFEG